MSQESYPLRARQRYILYFGPSKIFEIVSILAHSSSASTTARAWWILFPTVTTPWFLIITARTSSPVFLSSNTLETIFAKSIDPGGLFITIMGIAYYNLSFFNYMLKLFCRYSKGKCVRAMSMYNCIYFS